MAETNTHVCDVDGLVMKRKGGGSIVSLPPVFSSDSRILYVAWGNSVRAYSTQTGSVLFEFGGISSRCSSLQLLLESDSLAACSEKGEVIFWDCSSAVIQEKRVLELPDAGKITGCHIFGREKDIFIVLWKEQQKFQQLLRFKSSCKDFDEIKVKLNNSQSSFAVGGQENSQYVGTIYKCNVYAVNLRNGKIVRLFVHSERRYTCIAAHKSDHILAVGGIDGCITIWRGFFEQGTPPRSVYHWHTLPVNAICFSETGTSLFSGGGECVMVRWLLEYQEKNFLPRMGSPISHLAVSPGNQLVAASMADNSIQLISPRLTIEKVIQNFTWNVNIGSKETHSMGINKMRFDPRTKSLVLNGLSGHLQFFSAYTNSLLYNLDVVGQNFLTQERNRTIYNTEVVHVAFSCNGNWMATVEVRKDPDFSLESRLKFWRFNEEKQNFGLNTCIESPHIGEICALEMKPGTEDFYQLMAVTSGEDEKFKIWTLMDSSTVREGKGESGEVWHCESVGVYKGLPSGDVGFSSDGSILGAAFAYTLTLWVPDANELKSSLTHPDYHQNIRKLQFGSGDCCHLTVILLPECIIVWNIFSLTMTWAVPIEVSILTADPFSSHMAVFTCSGDLIVFKPSEPQPVLIKPTLSENKILLAAFVPLTKSRSDLMQWQHKSQLYFMNEYQELLVLESQDNDSKEAGHGEAVQGNLSEKSDLNLTPFGLLLAGVKHISNVKPVIPSDYSCDGIPGKEKIDELLRMPAHTMPPLHSICYRFLTSLIKKIGNNSKDEESDAEMEEDENMDDKDSESGSENSVKHERDKSDPDKINLQDKSENCKVVRPKVESTPELEAHLQEVFNESSKWVKAL
ncbi:WD repeat-containing protein 75 [Hetaerina americana]|uniref:WD repeat-containing protein 75 n=1 Tax=Hetaerina americana TaxID=62018 RepID=UPI003A7F3D6F